MKNYKFLRAFTIIAMLMFIPIFLTSILFGFVSLDYMMKGNMLSDQMKGNLNNPFIVVLCVLCVLSTCIIFPALGLSLGNLKSNCELDDEKQRYRDATKQMEKVRDEYSKKLLN